MWLCCCFLVFFLLQWRTELICCDPHDPDKKIIQCAEQTFVHQIRLNLNKPKFIYIYIFTICIYLLTTCCFYIAAMLFLVMLDTCLDFVLGNLAKDGIIEKSEALMVARGDLGYSAAMSFASHPF